VTDESGMRWWLRYVIVPLLAGSGLVGLVSLAASAGRHSNANELVPSSHGANVREFQPNDEETRRILRQLRDYTIEMDSIELGWRTNSDRVDPLAKRVASFLQADYPASAMAINQNLRLVDAGALLGVLRLEIQKVQEQIILHGRTK
jgi:hypothetical protein